MRKRIILKPFSCQRMFLLFYIALLGGFSVRAQTISATIDSTVVDIGAPIRYKLSVYLDSLSSVDFPVNINFSPFVVTDSTMVDTLREQKGIILTRQYTLSGFDEKLKYIPQQQLAITGKIFVADSIPIEIRTVQVDTISREYYDVKPIDDIALISDFNWTMLLYALLIIAVLILAYRLYLHKRKHAFEKKSEENLPPFERANKLLDRLSTSDYLEKSYYKNYYSELISIFKYYLEEEISLSVLESTSDELLLKIKAYTLKHDIATIENTLNRFGEILHHSDMAKFAKMMPSRSLINDDFEILRMLIAEFNNTLPQDIVQARIDEAIDREEQKKKTRRRRWRYSLIGTGVLLLVGVLVWVLDYGVRRTIDSLMGQPTLEWLESKWVTSDYGFPPVTLSTPDILKRITPSDSIQQGSLAQQQARFEIGDVSQGMLIVLDQVHFPKPVEDDTELSKMVTSYASQQIEAFGGKNIISKQDTYTNAEGSEGIKIYGDFDLELGNGNLIKVSYTTLTFISKSHIVQLQIAYPKGDDYAIDIEQRIIESLKFKAVSP